MKYFIITICREDDHDVNKSIVVELSNGVNEKLAPYLFAESIIGKGYLISATETNKPLKSNTYSFAEAVTLLSNIELKPVEKNPGIKRVRTKNPLEALHMLMNGATSIHRDGNRFVVCFAKETE